MGEDFKNVYDDDARAAAYSGLEYPGTYFLAFRDIPALITRHCVGQTALDFGCGTGRSTRFLRDLGFDVVGVDIADRMLVRARARDPVGDYRLIEGLDGSFDLILCAFTFDNIRTPSLRLRIFKGLGQLLSENGRIINLVSAPEIYVNEWASFSTRDFPENRAAQSGDEVRIVMLDVPDRRPIEDTLWTEADYRRLYSGAGLDVLEMHAPLGSASDPCSWVTEERISPWGIYVLDRCGGGKKSAILGDTHA
jgi:SAM-dependent methyltransferase